MTGRFFRVSSRLCPSMRSTIRLLQSSLTRDRSNRKRPTFCVSITSFSPSSVRPSAHAERALSSTPAITSQPGSSPPASVATAGAGSCGTGGGGGVAAGGVVRVGVAGGGAVDVGVADGGVGGGGAVGVGVAGAGVGRADADGVAVEPGWLDDDTASAGAVCSSPAPWGANLLHPHTPIATTHGSATVIHNRRQAATIQVCLCSSTFTSPTPLRLGD